VPPQGGRKHPQQEFLQVDTSNMLFIVGGAFAGLDRLIRERSEHGGVGFGAEVMTRDERPNVGEVLREVEPEDLISYGLIPEFVGRLPVVATLEELDAEALVRILTEPKNAIIKQYSKLFEMEGCEFEMRDSALYEIAHKAMARNTGARGLRTIIEGVLLNTMYELPSLEGVKRVIVDDAVVRGEASPYLLLEGRENEPVRIEEATQQQDGREPPYRRAASDE